MSYLKKFNNGLSLVINRNEGVRSVTVAVGINAGSSFEDAHNNGYAHFIEHLLFKGTKRRTALEISETIEAIGGQINASTSKDMTLYYTKTASEHLEKSMELLSDMLFNSNFDEEEIEREKSVVIEEILMGQDQPDDVCHDLIAKALFGSHSLGRSITGTVQNIKSATRESILEFKDAFYTPDRIVISIAGNVDEKIAQTLAEAYFEVYLDDQEHSKAKPVKAAYKTKSLKEIKDIEQCHIAFAVPAGKFNAHENAANSVFSSLFGGGMSSRLFQAIREQNGLAYNVFSYLSSYDLNGFWEIYMGTNPKNTEKAVDLVGKEIKKIQSGGYLDSEFNKAREQQKGALILSLENTSTVAYINAKYVLKTGAAFDPVRRVDEMNAVTRADVDASLKRLLDLNLYAAAYVGKDTAFDILELLKNS